MEPNTSSDEESSFSTITAFTETPRSQSEISSVTTESTVTKNDSEITNEISSKFDMLIEQLARNKQIPKEMIKFCEGMKEQYLTQHIPDQSNYADVNKLKSLALRYTDLLSNVDHKSRSMEILKNANDELNQYISDMEDYHTKQMASLKAKISLNRIESEVQSLHPSLSPSVVSSVHQSPTKRRRSSIIGRFFSKNSGSSLPEISELNAIPIDPRQEEIKRIKEELINKTITIEELRKKSEQFEQKEKVLEAAIHNKNIELSRKTSRMMKLSDNLKSKSDSYAKSVMMLNKLQETAQTLNNKMAYTASDIRHNRVKVKENQEKVKKVENSVYATNEENKILLEKLNKRNYELDKKKTINTKLVKEVKKYLLSVISLAEEHGEGVMDEEASNKKDHDSPQDEDPKSQDQILKRLMKISKRKLLKLFQYNKKMIEETKMKKQQLAIVHQACQTTPPIFDERALLNAKVSEQKVRSDVKKIDDELRRIHQNKDSGMSIAGDSDQMYQHRMAAILKTQNHHYPSNVSVQQAVYRVSNDERNSPGGNQGPHYTRDFVDYLEHMKNREIEIYQEDLKKLERENYHLKISLDGQFKKVRKLQTDIQYDKTRSHLSPSKSSYIPTGRLSSSPYDTSPKTTRQSHYDISPKTTRSPQRSFHNTESFPSQPNFDFDDLTRTTALNDNFCAPVSNEAELFMDSFEKGSQLIQGVFSGRDSLERDLLLTRQQIQRNKGLKY